MKVKGLFWLGIRTDRQQEMVAFLRDVLGLKVDHQDDVMVALRMPNGDEVEVFGREDREHTHFTTGPVVGFLVDDVRGASAELEAAGVELLGEVEGGDGWLWQHFRAPDGNVYEVTNGPEPA